MPEGLLNALTPGQTRDLIAYLMHSQQVRLKKQNQSFIWIMENPPSE